AASGGGTLVQSAEPPNSSLGLDARVVWRGLGDRGLPAVCAKPIRVDLLRWLAHRRGRLSADPVLPWQAPDRETRRRPRPAGDGATRGARAANAGADVAHACKQDETYHY